MAKQSKATKAFSIGVDYGTSSVRSIIVDVEDGKEIASSVFNYPSGEEGILVDKNNPNLARQNPADYIEGFCATVRNTVAAASGKRGFKPELVVGIGVDSTGSTPLPVDENGMPLAMKPEFKKNLAAHAWLWKDHTSHAEAAEITEKAAKTEENYLTKCGGTYSSEWFWAKILHCKRTSPKVFDAAHTWVELSDFIPAFITGNTNPDTMLRNICAAGHKAMYHEGWGGLPKADFLKQLDPELVKVREHYRNPALTADQSAGGLTADVAAKVGLPEGVPVAVGAMDAHLGAVGVGITPGRLVKIIGTSTCDMMVAPLEDEIQDIPGVCGIVPGSVLPGMYGIEAGQSAVGDIFNWFVKFLTPSEFTAKGDVHVNLTKAAEKLMPGESGLLALDWNNGNRTILVDPLLAGVLIGQTLHTTAPEIYRAMIEATAFGALTIIRRLEEYGVPVKEVVNCGGIAEKSPMAMQIYADICNRPMKISSSPQTCALGAAICGAVVGSAYQKIGQAMKRMTSLKETVYKPNPAATKVYVELYDLYLTLHDAFGTDGYQGQLHQVLKKLINIRHNAKR